MPTYQYRCQKCQHEFETVQRISEDPLKTCPACQTENLKRIIGSIGVSFKGAGFHINDYKNHRQKPAAEKTTEK